MCAMAPPFGVGPGVCPSVGKRPGKVLPATLLRVVYAMLMAAAWPLKVEAAAPASTPINSTDVVSSILEFRLVRGPIDLEEFALVERWISPGLMQACRGYLRRRDDPNTTSMGVSGVQTDPVTGAEEALSERFHLDPPQDTGGNQVVIAHLFYPNGTSYGSRRFVLANLPGYGWRIINMGYLRTQCAQGP